MKNKEIYIPSIIIGLVYILYMITIPFIATITHKYTSLDYTLYKVIIGLIGFIIINLIAVFINPKLKKGEIALLIYILGSLFLSEIIMQILTTNNQLLNELIQLISPTILVIIFIILNRNELKNKFFDFRKNYGKYTSIALKNWVLGLIFMVGINLFLQLILHSQMAANEEANRELINTFPLYALTSILILAPLTEELIFRASFKKAFNNIYTFSTFTGILFGLLHVLFMGDYVFSLAYSALGFFLGKAYYETDNIYVSIFAHFFHNFACIILILLSAILTSLEGIL